MMPPLEARQRTSENSVRNLATKSGTHTETWAGGRGAPVAFVTGVRHREGELRRAFFSARFVRVLDSLGYARFRHWRLYGEEALVGREAALWLATESLTVEHGGDPLSRFEVKLEPATGELRSVGRPRLFEVPRVLPQPRLFALDALGEGGWLKVMRLEGYATRAPRRPGVFSRRSSCTTKPWASFPVQIRHELRTCGVRGSSARTSWPASCLVAQR